MAAFGLMAFGTVNWGGVFVPDLSLAESFIRGSVVYLSIIVLFRVALRRQGGSIGLPDIMLVVLVSECVSATLSAEAKSLPNGLAAVSALLFWSYLLDRLGHRWPWFQRLLEPPPSPLVRDGKPLRENLAREGICDEELNAQLRLNGIAGVSGVKLATLESDGNVSVIPNDSQPQLPTPPQSDSPPDFDHVLRRFLTAATELQKAVAWHEERATAHRAAAGAARKVLKRHGVRTPPANTRSFHREDAEGTEVAPPPTDTTEARP